MLFQEQAIKKKPDLNNNIFLYIYLCNVLLQLLSSNFARVIFRHFFYIHIIIKLHREINCKKYLLLDVQLTNDCSSRYRSSLLTRSNFPQVAGEERKERMAKYIGKNFSRALHVFQTRFGNRDLPPVSTTLV